MVNKMVNYNRFKIDSNPVVKDLNLDFEIIQFWCWMYQHVDSPADCNDIIRVAMCDLMKYPYL